MPTATLPSSIHDQAWAVVARSLKGRPSFETRLAEFGDVAVVALLLDLEDRFGIGIDVDEVLPQGTVGLLLALVEIRVRTGGQRIPGSTCQLYDFDAARARRAQAAFAIPDPPPDRRFAPGGASDLSDTPAAPSPSDAAERPGAAAEPQPSAAATIFEREHRARLVLDGALLCVLAALVAGLAVFGAQMGWLA